MKKVMVIEEQNGQLVSKFRNIDSLQAEFKNPKTISSSTTFNKNKIVIVAENDYQPDYRKDYPTLVLLKKLYEDETEIKTMIKGKIIIMSNDDTDLSDFQITLLNNLLVKSDFKYGDEMKEFYSFYVD